MSRNIKMGKIELELLTNSTEFLGIGRIAVAGTDVRTGSLPMRPYTATHNGIEFDRFILDDIQDRNGGMVLRTRALGVQGQVAALLDHSLDPVWSSKPWDGRKVTEIKVEWEFAPATRTIGEHTYEGFTYAFHVETAPHEIYYLLDRATWELGGDAVGITLLRQQMGTDPRVTLHDKTSYSTSSKIGYPINPIMTHDIPRWASEQGFDYQYRNGTALIGLFAKCGLIRTIVERDAGDPGIRHFDKHIFDQTADARTVTKFIGVTNGISGDISHLNAWTRVFDADQDNILGEFGMRRTYPRTTLCHNFWNGFTAESYRTDLMPAAAALGFQQLFIDPFWENDMTRKREGKLPEWTSGNMCCPHEYEVAAVLGGIPAYKQLAADARKDGIELISWIGSHQSVLSPYLTDHNVEIIKQADGRHWYGSGYDCIYGMDIASPFGTMFRASALRATAATGVSGFLYDSFYNFGFMPINFHTPDSKDPGNIHAGTLKVHTQWRQLVEIMAAWQRAGMHMLIESLGPWGQPQHGVGGAYDAPGCEALAYQCAVSIGYSVIPVPSTAGAPPRAHGPEFYYRLLANKAPNTLSVWVKNAKGEQERIDRVADPLVRQANLDYRAVLPQMHTRTLLQEDAGVIWKPATGKEQVLFSYRKQEFPVAAGIAYRDQTTGIAGVTGTRGLPAEPFHTYVIGG